MEGPGGETGGGEEGRSQGISSHRPCFGWCPRKRLWLLHDSRPTLLWALLPFQVLSGGPSQVVPVLGFSSPRDGGGF